MVGWLACSGRGAGEHRGGGGHRTAGSIEWPTPDLTQARYCGVMKAKENTAPTPRTPQRSEARFPALVKFWKMFGFPPRGDGPGVCCIEAAGSWGSPGTLATHSAPRPSTTVSRQPASKPHSLAADHLTRHLSQESHATFAIPDPAATHVRVTTAPALPGDARL